MKSTKNLHYIPQSYQRRFANDKDQIAYMHMGAPATVTNVRNAFSRKVKGVPLFNEDKVTDREQTVMALIAYLDDTDEGHLKEALKLLSKRDNRLKLPLTTDFLGCLCDFAVLQMTREPEWQAAYLQSLADTGMTHREYFDTMLKSGDPYTRAGQALNAQCGLSVVVSTRDEFVFGSQFMTPMTNGDFIIPVGRRRSLLLTKDRRFTVKRAFANSVARYNRQILMRAESCGAHPDNRDFLFQWRDKLGSKRQPFTRVQIPTNILRRLGS